MKMESYPIPYTKIGSKWIKDLYVEVKTMKLLQENIRGKHDLGFGKGLLDMTPKA